jgi:hypothetical protein
MACAAAPSPPPVRLAGLPTAAAAGPAPRQPLPLTRRPAGPTTPSRLPRTVARESAKNYQLWNHRAKIAAALGPAGAPGELAFASRFLDADEKNYHAWAHRQAVVAAAGLWEEELAYSEAMIERDVANNSAWAERAFVKLVRGAGEGGRGGRGEGGILPGARGLCTSSSRLTPRARRPALPPQALLDRQLKQQQEPNGAGAAAPAGPAAAPAAAARPAFLAVLPGEFEYVAAQLSVAPRNESAWNYLAGLFAWPGATPHEMGRHKEVHARRAGGARVPTARPPAPRERCARPKSLARPR